MEERADVMTDYQMRTLLNLVLKIVDDNRDAPDKIYESLIDIRDGNGPVSKKKPAQPAR